MAPNDRAPGSLWDDSDADGRFIWADVESARVHTQCDHIRDAFGLGTARGRLK